MAFDFDGPPSDIRFPTNVAKKALGKDSRKSLQVSLFEISGIGLKLWISEENSLPKG